MNAIMTPGELRRLLEEARRPVIVDSRAPGDHAAGHVPGAINVADLGPRPRRHHHARAVPAQRGHRPPLPEPGPLREGGDRGPRPRHRPRVLPRAVDHALRRPPRGPPPRRRHGGVARRGSSGDHRGHRDRSCPLRGARPPGADRPHRRDRARPRRPEGGDPRRAQRRRVPRRPPRRRRSTSPIDSLPRRRRRPLSPTSTPSAPTCEPSASSRALDRSSSATSPAAARSSPSRCGIWDTARSRISSAAGANGAAAAPPLCAGALASGRPRGGILPPPACFSPVTRGRDAPTGQQDAGAPYPRRYRRIRRRWA